MTAYEIIELFESEVLKEIFDAVPDEPLQTILVDAVKEISKTVSETYEVCKNGSKEQ